VKNLFQFVFSVYPNVALFNKSLMKLFLQTSTQMLCMSISVQFCAFMVNLLVIHFQKGFRSCVSIEVPCDCFVVTFAIWWF